ncbi:hypothetical protein [Archangium violaceum]|uniref:Uncharacterized protein n=1 Tax=Archangium violaceum Cb vi76 TaxID=1406225 RepID=A0A084SPP9_9BACT|nr:hypothetical protein [Archangium violaceum]KFA90434.1 hypothetical protein Q664_28765 [Archangium violaceum Cb vi76]
MRFFESPSRLVRFFWWLGILNLLVILLINLNAESVPAAHGPQGELSYLVEAERNAPARYMRPHTGWFIDHGFWLVMGPFIVAVAAQALHERSSR